MKEELTQLLISVLGEMGITDVTPHVSKNDNSRFGEYATNIAMVLGKRQKKNPIEIATELKSKLVMRGKSPEYRAVDHKTSIANQTIADHDANFSVLQAIAGIEIAPPGFLNITIGEAALSKQVSRVLNEKERYGTRSFESVEARKKGEPKRVMVEFAHPNTHKAFHIGHLRNISTGESIVRLLESTGHEVIRANYQGDVGMHIAKCLYGIQQNQEFKKQSSELKTVAQKVEFLGKAYAAGSKAYEDPEHVEGEKALLRQGSGGQAKVEIGEINKKIYSKDPSIYPLYQETRRWSLEYFDSIYKRVGSHYDRLYFESEVYESGKANVLKGLEKGIFEKSEGAIIFPGKKFGLHNRVFISGEGNATYEAKDMGLGPLQFSEYHPDRIVHVVGPEQAGYFQVVFEALAQLFPDTRGRQFHLVYGWVKLKQGKMSSRSGNVVLGEWLLDEAKKEIKKIFLKSDESDARNLHSDALVAPQKAGLAASRSTASPAANYSPEKIEEIAEKAAVAAVKYAFLKVATKSEIAFDFAESVNLSGDSGPYLQYTYARCKSVMRKTSLGDLGNLSHLGDLGMNPEERAVARLILFYPEVVSDASASYSPNILCTYLFQLAQTFNLFYAKHSILGDEKSEKEVRSFRLSLTAATAQVIKNGLYLLGIETMEEM